MSVVHTFRINVEFGDCDPAQIVYYPNFLRWIDAASRNYFVQSGVPLWHELEKTIGIIGTPILDAHLRFAKPASYGDRLEIETEVIEWRNRTFVMRHRIRRGDDLLVECTEVRAFVRRLDDDPKKIQAVPVPDDIKRMCGG
jgi:4-hydroxybenzoyl-CoA thioesterase